MLVITKPVALLLYQLFWPGQKTRKSYVVNRWRCCHSENGICRWFKNIVYNSVSGFIGKPASSYQGSVQTSSQRHPQPVLFYREWCSRCFCRRPSAAVKYRKLLLLLSMRERCWQWGISCRCIENNVCCAFIQQSHYFLALILCTVVNLPRFACRFYRFIHCCTDPQVIFSVGINFRHITQVCQHCWKRLLNIFPVTAGAFQQYAIIWTLPKQFHHCLRDLPDGIILFKRCF